MVGRLVCLPVLKSHALLALSSAWCWKDPSPTGVCRAGMPDLGGVALEAPMWVMSRERMSALRKEMVVGGLSLFY